MSKHDNQGKNRGQNSMFRLYRTLFDDMNGDEVKGRDKQQLKQPEE